MDQWWGQWLSAIRALTATPEGAAKYLDARLRFITAVARSLTHENPQLDSLVYGVWLVGHESPIYIGQTRKGRRRLWDLPIGESHHLANSFPPEIWSRVVVVYWGQLLSVRPELSERIAAAIQPIGGQDPRPAIGLGLEHLLQRRYQPLFNRRKKRRDGRPREVAWEVSESVGARAAPHLAELLDLTVTVWERLAAVPCSVATAVELPGGRVVFPTTLDLAHAPDQFAEPEATPDPP